MTGRAAPPDPPQPDAAPSRPQAGANRFGLTLFLPGLVLIAVFLGLPLANLVRESFRTYQAGGVGAVAGGALTFENYTDLIAPAYLRFLLDTLWISGASGALAVGFGLLFAYKIARTPSPSIRKSLLAFLVVLLFLSVLVRIYAIVLTFGPVGVGGAIFKALGVKTNSRGYAELMVVLGFLHYLVPISALMLVGTIQNISPSFFEAASSMGSPTWRAHLDATLPLAMPGITSAFLVSFSLAVSSFVIPLILGRGKVQFLANLTYARFSEIADYPSGAAIAVLLLAISLAIVGLVGLCGSGRRGGGVT